jgi:hypothetical protein
VTVVDSEQERLCRGPELLACEVNALLAERHRCSRA